MYRPLPNVPADNLAAGCVTSLATLRRPAKLPVLPIDENSSTPPTTAPTPAAT
jgi:hypothetical protein